MHRIDHATAAPGNLFTEGNPATATPATTVTDDWLNDVQENVCEVIEYAGLALVKGTATQLRDAIVNMINAGGDIKTPVRAATTADIASLAGGAPSTLDGVTLAGGDRILVKNQATASQNGIYIVTTLGSGANGTWTRATDADGVGELKSGMIITVTEGNTYPDTVWELATNGTITIGSTALTFQWAGGLIGLTQAQFDNSAKLATTAFVRAAKGGTSGLNSFNASTTLVLADVGKQIFFYGSTASQTITLPDASTVPAGEGYWITNQASVAVTLKGNGSQNLSINLAGVGQSLSNTTLVNPGDSIFVPSNGASQWNIHGYTSAGQFLSSVTSPGYQKLPSGLILQWGNSSFSTGGSSVTFPIAFSNSLFAIILGQGGNGGGYIYTQSQGLTGFSGYVSAGTTTTHWWLAIGK